MKRFFDTEIMLKPWFRALSPRLKCLWIWMLSRCDMAGVLVMDWDLASFAIGEKVGLSDLKELNGNAVVVPGSNKLILPDFIKFQYGELKDECRVHQGVIKCLTSHDIQYPFDSLLKKTDTLSGTPDRAKVKDKDKDKVIKGGMGGKEKDGHPSTLQQFIDAREKMIARAQEKYPKEDATSVYDLFVEYLQYKGTKYKRYDLAFLKAVREGWFERSRLKGVLAEEDRNKLHQGEF